MSLKTVLTITLLTIVLHASNGLSTGRGKERGCDSMSQKTVSDFDYDKFAGDWFVVFMDKKIENTKCTSFTFSPNHRGEMTEDSYNTQLHKFHTTVVRADPPSKKNENMGQLDFTMSLRGFFTGTKSLHYFILDTDYDNYAIVYTCTDIPLAKNGTVAILSRTQTLDEDFNDAVDLILEFNDLPTLIYLEEHTQDCDEFSCHDDGKNHRKCGYKRTVKSKSEPLKHSGELFENY